MLEALFLIVAVAFCFVYVRPTTLPPALRSRVTSIFSKRGTKGQSLSATKTTSSAPPPKERTFGIWTPEPFAYPAIESCKDFRVDEVVPIPYRPFRWGPNYPINLGIGAMPWNNWLELDQCYRKTLAIRRERTETRGDKAHRTLPGFMPHAEECLQEMCSFLSQRYPDDFTVSRVAYVQGDESTYGDSIAGVKAGAVAGILNKITGDRFDFVKLRKEEGSAWDPMKYAGLLQQDDLAVMVEDAEGHYRFQAGSICTAGFWRLEDKIGRTLHDIHVNGKVPQFKEKLKFSMERFFQKQKVNAPVQRNNYFFQIDDQLAWSEHTNGPEDIFDQATKAPKDDEEGRRLVGDFKPPEPTDDFDKIYFRTERQTLRRMPKTGCILFTIRTYFHAVHDLVKEPGVPGRMASAIRSWPADVREYKGGDLYTDLLVPRLNELHQQQIADGIVKLDQDGEVVGRDVRTYPF